MITDDGQKTVNPDEILIKQSEYYQEIYEPKQEYVITENENTIPSLSEEERVQCEGHLTYVECFNVLNSMPKNKSPGNGLFSEWYLRFEYYW